MNRYRNKIFILCLILVVGFISLYIIKRSFENDAARLKRIIYLAENAVEEENLAKCISFISYNYRDKYNNNREGLLLIGSKFFSQYKDISIVITHLELDIDTDFASAEIEAIGYGRGSTATPTITMEYEKATFRVDFKKEGKYWKVIELEFYEPEDFLFLKDFIGRLERRKGYDAYKHSVGSWQKNS